MAEIVVIGSANLDLVVRVPELPREGETRLGDAIEEFFGGKGANQAVAAWRALGPGRGTVAFIGKVGEDAHGERYRAFLSSEGIDTSGLMRTGEAPTGVALIMVDNAGRRLIAVAPGANARLSPPEVEARRGLFLDARVCLAQLEVPLEAVAAAFRMARDGGALTLLNADPVPPRPFPALEELLGLCDGLILNASEALALLGRGTVNMEKACSALRGLGPQTVVITLGEEGAIYETGEGSGRVRPPPVHAVDTTAAGDAFCGALAASLAQGETWKEAVPFACAAGALACTVRGAQPSLPREGEIRRLLRA